MQKLSAPVILLALLAVFLPACTNVGRLVATGLRVEVTGIERASDGTISASWHVANSNIVAYLLSQVSHKIYLNGAYLGATMDKEPLGVPASSNAGRTTKLAGGDAAVARVLAEAAAHGSANYRVETQLIILIYGDSTEKANLTGTGVVPVTAK